MNRLSPRNITCVEDLKHLARKRVPRMFYDYVDSGAWTETTYRANSADLAGIHFRQRIGKNVNERSQRSKILGQEATMPVVLAPTGLAGMQYPDGEILAARAAERFGVPFTLSTMSVCSIEDVAEHTSQPFWFQLYLMKDRSFIERLIRRAREARCSALVLTLDLPVQGQRHKDIKNGLSAPPKPTIQNLFDFAVRPRWCLNMLRTKRHSFRNIIGHVEGVSDVTSMARWVEEQFDQQMSWENIQWIRRIWDGKLVLKGIMDPEDAQRAVEYGADALVVSNHGGRQLDGALSSIMALPRIARAVGGETEILFDGGIQSGQDVLKALALGAHGTLIGRSFLYGLGAMGGTGVTRCLEIIQKEMDLTMALCGLSDVREADERILESQEEQVHFPWGRNTCLPSR